MKILSYGFFFRAAVVAIGILLVIQLVPYGRQHSNPPVVREPPWNNVVTRNLASRACFDCHSNQTVWPGYAAVAPVSWLIYHDVIDGRKKLNFSEWQGGARKGENLDKIRKELAEGEMPPIQYRLAHPKARLTDDEKRLLVDGLAATMNGGS